MRFRARSFATYCCAALALLAQSLAAAYTIQGEVVTREGTAVPNARVWLNRSRVAQVVTTGADGRFRFEDIAAGPVQLVAYADGLAIGGIEGPCTRDEDLQLLLDAPQTTRLRIINRRYEPIEGARVRKLTVNDSFTVLIEDLADLGFPAAISNEEGDLELPPLPRDAFVSVSISARGYADGQLPALPSGIQNLDFPLPDGLKVVGRVTDRGGAGVARSRVSIYQPRENGATLQFSEVRTGPEGFFSALVPPGAYYVAARHPDYAMPEPVKIEVRDLQRQAEANLQLADPHRLEGRALDDAGSPVPLARFAYHLGDYVVDEAVSDIRGRFQLTVPEGQGVIQVRAPYRMTTKLFPKVYMIVPADAPELEIPTVEFRPLPEIEGAVTLPDGSAGANVLISSLNLTPPYYTTTDETGRFVLSLDAIPEETLRFRAEHALRLLRDEFEIDPLKLEAPPIRLKEFEAHPPPADAWSPNDLHSLVGRPAPELACKSWLNLPPDVDELTVDGLRGTVVVLTMWTSFDYLGPSRYRADEMNKVYSLYEQIADVSFVSIHDSAVVPEDVSRYVRELGIRYPVGCDADPYETFARYLTQQIPQTVLIDRNGNVRFYATEGRLLELIKILRRE